MDKVLMFLFLFCSYWIGAQTQEVYLVDDFNNHPLNNDGLPTMPFDSNAIFTKETIDDFPAFCHTGKSLQMNFDVSLDTITSFAGLVSPLDRLNLSNYNYLSFWIRGLQDGIYLQVELERLIDGNEDNTESAKVAVWNYLECGPSDEWQKVVIPLDAFWNLAERTDIVKLVLGFDYFSSNANNSPLAGSIQIDEILFGSYFVGRVKLDPFNDLIKSDAVGGNIGEFSQMDSTGNYQSFIDLQGVSPASCDYNLEVHYDNGEEDEFGGVFFILGGDATGWGPIGKNLSEYHSLNLKAWAEHSSTNPGNVKLELKSEDLGHTARVFNIGLSPQDYSLPLSGFIPPIGEEEEIREFVIVFERSYQQKLSGVLHVDEIEFRASGYQFPDLAMPGIPQNLMVNGAPPSGTIPLQGNVTVSATIQNNDERLESVRLEYYLGCDWYCLERTYAPFNSPQASFTFSANALPGGLPLKMRVVAENYNGISSSSEEFQAMVEAAGAIDPEKLFRNSYAAFEFLRTETGVYSDAINLNGEQFHPVSVATTGMGLIALCIADAKGWIPNAEELALETLKSMNGLRPGFQPERNCAGWFRHFIKAETGAQEWDSEFSSIDSGILTAGALFCKKYFSNNDSIGLLADALYLSTDWESMLETPATGEIYLISDCEGNGQFLTKPYNEYMLVAWLAKNDFRNNDIANLLWEGHYADPAELPKSNFMGIEVLSDFSGNFLSGFVHQFTHYLCNYYTNHPGYQQFFDNAMRVDSLWWRKNTDTYCYVWGFGAGSSCDIVPSFYNADNIMEHPGTLCSPHIIAGFIPVNPNGLNDLLNLHATPLGVYHLPDDAQTPVLWRFSEEDPAWTACDLQGIDFSTMLLGLAAHPSMLGNAFFSNNNDFNYPSANTTAYPPAVEMPDMIIIEGDELRLSVWDIVPGVAPSMLEWSFQGYDPNHVQISVDDCKCEIVFKRLAPFTGTEPFEYTVVFPGGDTVQGTTGGIIGATFEEHGSDRLLLLIGQNYPNPFNTTTIIPFQSTQRGNAWLKIFDARGKTVYNRTLGELIPGSHETEWNGRDQKGDLLPAGTYFYAIKVGNLIRARKMSTYR